MTCARHLIHVRRSGLPSVYMLLLCLSGTFFLSRNLVTCFVTFVQCVWVNFFLRLLDGDFDTSHNGTNVARLFGDKKCVEDRYCLNVVIWHLILISAIFAKKTIRKLFNPIENERRLLTFHRALESNTVYKLSVVIEEVLTEIAAFSSHYHYRCRHPHQLLAQYHFQLLWLLHYISVSTCMAMEAATRATRATRHLQYRCSIDCPTATIHWNKIFKNLCKIPVNYNLYLS